MKAPYAMLTGMFFSIESLKSPPYVFVYATFTRVPNRNGRVWPEKKLSPRNIHALPGTSMSAT